MRAWLSVDHCNPRSKAIVLAMEPAPPASGSNTRTSKELGLRRHTFNGPMGRDDAGNRGAMGIADLLLDLCGVEAACNCRLEIGVGLINAGINDRDERAKAGGHRMGRSDPKFFQGILNAGGRFALLGCLAPVIIIGLRGGYPAIALQGGKHRVHRAVAGNAAAYDAPAEECHFCPLQDHKIIRSRQPGLRSAVRCSRGR